MKIYEYIKKIKTVDSSQTISEFAISSVKDKNKYQFPHTCAVVKNNKLVGSLSYGDIKRKFHNIEKTYPISKIMNKKPIKLKLSKNENIFYQNLKKIEKKYNIEFVYVIDSNDYLLGVIETKQVSNFNNINFCDTVIFGLGFVGLTLMMHLVKHNIRTNGIDKNKNLISNLKKNKSQIKENGLLQILKSVNNSNKNSFNIKLNSHNLSKVFIVTVGTPVINKKINLDYVNDCLKNISQHLTLNSLVILRSTIPIGSSRTTFIPLIEKISKLKCGTEWNFVFAPERTVEGNALNELSSLPQILSGYTGLCSKRGEEYFSKFTNEIIQLKSLEMAEFSKLICNTYRDLNFAFANDVALLSEKYNINAHNLINLTNKGYPRGGIPVPSPGVGGTCLSKDPFLYSLSNVNKKFYKSNLGLISRQINLKSSKVPIKILNNFKRKITNNRIKILILGLSFKGDFPNKDVRDSSAKNFADYCIKLNYETAVFDPFFEKKEIIKLGFKYYDFNKPVSKKINFIFVLNNNGLFKNINLSYWFESNINKVFFDGWNLFPELNIQKDNFVYTTMGKIK